MAVLLVAGLAACNTNPVAPTDGSAMRPSNGRSSLSAEARESLQTGDGEKVAAMADVMTRLLFPPASGLPEEERRRLAFINEIIPTSASTPTPNPTPPPDATTNDPVGDSLMSEGVTADLSSATVVGRETALTFTVQLTPASSPLNRIVVLIQVDADERKSTGFSSRRQGVDAQIWAGADFKGNPGRATIERWEGGRFDTVGSVTQNISPNTVQVRVGRALIGNTTPFVTYRVLTFRFVGGNPPGFSAVNLDFLPDHTLAPARSGSAN